MNFNTDYFNVHAEAVFLNGKMILSKYHLSQSLNQDLALFQNAVYSDFTYVDKLINALSDLAAHTEEHKNKFFNDLKSQHRLLTAEFIDDVTSWYDEMSQVATKSLE